MKTIKVLVGSASKGNFKAATVLSLWGLQDYTYHHSMIEGAKVELDGLQIDMSGLLPLARSMVVDAARARKVDYILWVDDDMQFPPNALCRMLSWRKPIVAANYVTRNYPARPVARTRSKDRWGMAQPTRIGDDGLAQSWVIGFGLTLTELSIFQKIEKPWFLMTYTTEGPKPTYMGEDWYFAEKAEAAGIPVYIDHGLSQQVQHHGDFAFKHSMVEAE